jgi:hypothetical protein
MIDRGDRWFDGQLWDAQFAFFDVQPIVNTAHARYSFNRPTPEQAAIMAQRKKRATVRRKSTAHGKTRKTSKSARAKAAKRTVAKPTPRKRSAKAKPKLVRAKKVARKKGRPMKPLSGPVVETRTVDVIEEPAPGLTVVTEIEATDVFEPGAEQPEEK